MTLAVDRIFLKIEYRENEKRFLDESIFHSF